MPINWAAALSMQAALAKKMSKTVLDALAGDGLSIERVHQIDASVRRCAGTFDRVSALMRSFDVDRPTQATAEAIDAIWANLSQITAERLRLKQGGAHAPAPPRKAS